MDEKDFNMTYEQVWGNMDRCIHYIYFKKFDRPKSVEFDDFNQECAYVFWCKMIKKYTPFQCYCMCPTVFNRVLIGLLYPYFKWENGKCYWRANPITTCELTADIEYHPHNYQEATEEDFDELYPTWRKFAALVAEGYTTSEICERLGVNRNQVYDKIKYIKRYYANKYGIENYQRKHLRSFNRSEENKALCKIIHKPKCRAIKAKDANGRVVYIFDSIKEAEKVIAGGVQGINSAMSHGTRWHGYYWEYADKK